MKHRFSKFGAMGVGLAIALAATTARAEDEFNRPGPFVGLGMNYAVPGFQGATGRADFGDSLGFNARGGYRLNEFFAAEGIYEYVDDFGAGDRFANADIQTNTFTLNGKLILPLQRFQPYLEGGVGFLNANGDVRIEGRRASNSGTSFAGRVGGGIDFFATEKISLYADTSYTMPVDEVRDLYTFNLGWGARYNF
ncbi:MAG TPA: outer membrane beta-barrel protein [Candidatus Binatia bacterium]|nr:outer membrane beta-barrel protein [Candidatus Binatia bacterium]